MDGGRAEGGFITPTTMTVEVVDDYHGTAVADPYRWLEDLDAPETAAWIAEQNRITFDHLGRIAFRDAIRDRLRELWNYDKDGVPWRAGDRYFWMHQGGLQNQAVLRTAPSLDAHPRTLLDPNTWSEDGTVALTGVSVSRDGNLVAYGTSEAGSDWQVWRIIDVESGGLLEDELRWVKFTQPAWLPDGSGIFYGRYEATEGRQKLEDTNRGQMLCLHRVGTPQDDDTVVFHRPDHPDWLIHPQVSEDDRWLVLQIYAGSASENGLFLKPLEADEVIELLDDFDATYTFIDRDGQDVLVHTTRDAPLGRVVAINAASPEQGWRELIPEGDDAIQGVSAVGDRLFVHRLHHVASQVEVYERDGTSRATIPLPGLGTAVGFTGRGEHTETFFSFSSFTVPSTVYRYDLVTGDVEPVFVPDLPFDPSRFTTTQAFVLSKDGTRFPIFLTHRRDVTLDGERPTFLYGYGGFANAVVPAFALTMVPWLEAGGVYVTANIRGGSEYGEGWHLAGTKERKQNVFDDFIAAAEWLIDSGVTSRRRLAISGGSNGGLLVGACLTQRPDLYGAAHAAVGVLDMLRYHRYTIGWAWASDYGTSEDPDAFKYLYAYSPLHNVKPGTSYPPVLLTTGDHDDRVVPSHSFKFAATLQPAQAGPAPILLRVEVRAGHGMGKPTDKLIEEAADVRAFLLDALGATYEPPD